MLYDADKVLEAASTTDDQGLYEAQRDVFLDPFDPEVIREAEKAGIARDWIDAAQRSPIYALINTYKVALPLHPEYRTMPMVWYIPPLSPVVDVVARDRRGRRGQGQPLRRDRRAADPGRVPRRAVHRRRRRAGRRRAEEARRDALLHARHQHGPRPGRLDPGGGRDDRGGDVRHVPAPRDREVRRALRHPAGPRRAGALPRGAGHRVLGLEYGGGRAGRLGSSARGPGRRPRSRSRTSRCSRTGRPPTRWPGPRTRQSRVNLLNWDGKGSPPGLFPPKGERTRERPTSQARRCPPSS